MYKLYKKNIFLLILFLILGTYTTNTRSEVLEDLWNKYSDEKNNQPQEDALPQQSVKTDGTGFPGRLLGDITPEREAIFTHKWLYRSKTYELHYDNSQSLARTIYGIALYVKDIDTSLPVDKFINGVLGYHYSVNQICDWINAVIGNKAPSPKLDECLLLGMLLEDKILTLNDGAFVSTGVVTHVLAAAPGKKRSFASNLRHERLHSYWDENEKFRKDATDAWHKLSEADRQAAMKKLARYAKNNVEQLIEEWAVHESELSNISLD
jgi:hypothetical protein